jgi:hypothetical protein
VDYVPKEVEPWKFFFGITLVAIAFIVGRAVTLNIYSKIIGPQNAGLYMGQILAIGAIARIIGPIWSVRAASVGLFLVFGMNSVFFVCGLITVIIGGKDLKPHLAFSIDKGIKLEDEDMKDFMRLYSPKYEEDSPMKKLNSTQE